MSVTIQNITIRNFLSVGNVAQELDLSLHGLTLVLGENVDVGGGNSRNGAGKTTLLQAISYVLYGEPITKIRLDNCVNNINNKNMLVTIELVADGKNYRIERGRKPSVLRLFEDGVDTNEAKGENKNTQIDIDNIIGMSHSMFLQIVALNTFTDPFMKMKAADQRSIIEELLGITQLSQRAAVLKTMIDDTKEQLRDAEAMIKATIEANTRIEQAIERAKQEAEVWQVSQDRLINDLVAKAEVLNEIDIDAEIAVFDSIDEWLTKKKEIESLSQSARDQVETLTQEITRLQKELARYESEANRADNGEIARLEAQIRRYAIESEKDINSQLNRLKSEAERRRDEADRKVAVVEKLAVVLTNLQEQANNPDSHTCTTCGQGLGGTDHLKKITDNLKKQISQMESDIERTLGEADVCNTEALAIDEEIVQTKEKHEAEKIEAKNKIDTIKQEIIVARKNIEQQQKIATDRVTELREDISKSVELQTNHKEAVEASKKTLIDLGPQPKSKYLNRDAVWKIRQERDLLLNQIETALEKTNPNTPKIEGLQSTLSEIDYEPVNEYNIRLKHEVFLYKLLTAKDSFVRKKLVDQNLLYLNNRMNHYLERLGLPHEVRFLPDLTVEIALLGKELDFEQLSRGEMNRVILAQWWSFRNVWQNLNHQMNLLFVDEVLDFGLDDSGAEAALEVLRSMARDQGNNVFLISHKESLIGQTDRVLWVKKEDQFTTFIGE